MPRKRPAVITNPDKPHEIIGEKIEMYKKIIPQKLMNQYVKIPLQPPAPIKPINYVEEKTTISNLANNIVGKPVFSSPSDIKEFDNLREIAKGLLTLPNVTQSILQQSFQNKRFPNGMKAICYSCNKDIYFMDDFFIHAGTAHGAMLYETVETFIKLLDKIEAKEQGQI